MRIDHVIMGARDIGPVRELLRDGYGFGLVDGSPNADGTASWVVPFDTPDVQYLEVLVPHDEAVLRGEPFGEVFLDRTATGPTFLNWAVLVDDIAAAAARIEQLTGADPEHFSGESVRADGQRVPWAEAGFAASWAVPSRPFFLTYGNWPARRARLPGDLRDARHTRVPRAIEELELQVSGDGLADWLGGAPLPLTSRTGPADGVRSVTVGTDAGPTLVRLP